MFDLLIYKTFIVYVKLSILQLDNCGSWHRTWLWLPIDCNYILFAFENHIKSQNNCNLSANNHSPTQTVCNHSQTGWWKFAINSSQSPTCLQLVSLQQGNQLDWFPTVVSYIKPKLLSSYVILQLNCCHADLVAQPHSIAKLIVDWLQVSNVVRASFRFVSVKYNKHDEANCNLVFIYV